MIPPDEVSTELARQAIPAEVPLADAVANVSAAAMLVLGLRSADLDLLARGLHDRIHQDRRRQLFPRSMEIVDAAPELGALGATISGAGPPCSSGPPGRTPATSPPRWRSAAPGGPRSGALPFSPLGADVPEL